MHILKRLEKSKTFWYLIGVSILFFILRLPSLIEPNWYGDEGIYQTIGQAIAKGQLLYVETWDNKPPLLYIVYSLFNGDQFLVRLFSLITGALTALGFFFLSKLLFKNLRTSFITTLIFAVLFGLPVLEGNIANAENFMLLPIITSSYLIYNFSLKTNRLKFPILNSKFSILFTAGLLLGIAFLFKIVAIFDFAAFMAFFFFVGFLDIKIRNKDFQAIKRRLQSVLPNLLFIAFGFISPILITFTYFASKNAISPFVQAAFQSNVGYVGYGNKLIIPQGLLILKLILLSGFSLFLFMNRKKLSSSRIFILLWLAFSLFNTFFSGRPYTHYALVTLPSYCLLIGLLLDATKKGARFIFLIIFLSVTLLLHSTFKPNIKKAVFYYDNAFSFLTSAKQVSAYQSFFDGKTPRDYEIASFIKTHTTTQDQIFVWGDSAQIYALSNKQPPGKYTVSYHIKQYPGALQETQLAIDTVKPKYIITLNESSTLNFYLPSYTNKFVLKGAVIYERTF